MADDTIICPPPSGETETRPPSGPSEPLRTTAPLPTRDLLGKNEIIVEANDYQILPEDLLDEGDRQGITPWQHFTEPNFVNKPWQRLTRVSDEFRFYCRSYWTRELAESDLFRIEGRRDIEVERFRFKYASSTLIDDLNPFVAYNYPFPFFNQDELNEATVSPFFIDSIERQFSRADQGLRAGDFLYEGWHSQKITIRAKLRHFSEGQFAPPLINDLNFIPRYWEEFVKGTEATVSPGALRLRAQEDYPFTSVPPLIQGGTLYSDFSFKVTLPLLPSEMSLVSSADPTVSMAKWDPEYNFFIKGYESILKEYLVDVPGPWESLLPNMYVFIAEKLTEEGIDRQFLNFLTLGGTIRNTDVIPVPGERGQTGEKSVSVYYEEWARNFLSIVTQRPDDEFLEALARTMGEIEKYKRLLFANGVGASPPELLNEYNAKKFLFPMYVDVQFSTDRDTPVADLLSGKHRLINTIMKDTFNTRVENTCSPTRNIHGTQNFVYATSVKQGEEFLTDIKINQPTRYFDLSAWINSYMDQDCLEILRDDHYRLDKPPWMDIYAKEAERPLNNFPLRTQAILQFARMFRRRGHLEKFRTFKEIMSGELAESETLFYKIAKHQRNANGDVMSIPVEEVFLPNSSQVDVLNWIDTQVANEKRYRYIVYAYELVFGNNYRYVPPQNPGDFIDEGNGEDLRNAFSPEEEPEGEQGNADLPAGRLEDDEARLRSPGIGPEEQTFVTEFTPFPVAVVDNVPRSDAIFNVEVRPRLKVFEVPFFQFDTLVADKPPLPPDVEIVPYRGVNNQILFLLRSSTGEAVDFPVFLRDGDEEAFEIIRESQNLDTDEPLNWKGDDPAAAYEIFRMTTPPRSYRDFIGNLHMRVSAEEDLGCGRFLSTAFHKDEIQPNVKYYYIFREIDVHEKPSNPSTVFEVELVDDNGLIYPVIRPYDFPEPEVILARTLRRYLMIKPGIGQDDLVVENAGEVSSATDAIVHLGPDQDRVFPQPPADGDGPDDPNKLKFKVRVTSTQTGKKIDINVKFRHIHTKEFKCT